MRLRIRSKNDDLDETTRQLVERKVRLNLGRHTAGIDIARVTMRPADPDRNLTSPSCRIRVHLRHGPSLAAEAHAADLPSAAASAAWRLEQQLNRRRSARRPLASQLNRYAAAARG